MDCEIPEFFSESARIARKVHRCCECRKAINPGERYAYIVMKLDGVMFYNKQHERCYHFARHVNHELQYARDYDGCVGFGEIGNALQDAGEYYASYDDNDNPIHTELGALWQRVQYGFEFRPAPDSKANKYADVFKDKAAND